MWAKITLLWPAAWCGSGEGITAEVPGATIHSFSGALFLWE